MPTEEAKISLRRRLWRDFNIGMAVVMILAGTFGIAAELILIAAGWSTWKTAVNIAFWPWIVLFSIKFLRKELQ